MDKPTLSADQAFEQCINLLESSANLHFAYSDPSQSQFTENSDRDKWRWSGEFLQDAANKIKKLREAAGK